jgi:histone-lysine N-methyltransferase SETMAR
MASIFWDAHGVIFFDFLEKGKTITGPYYASLLDRLNEEIKTKRKHLLKKKVLFHHDNAPAHSSNIVQAKLHDLGYELLLHPPYSPDLAPCDYFLFLNLKTWLQGKKCGSNTSEN